MNFGPISPSGLLSSGATYGLVFALLAIPAFHYRGPRAIWGTWGLFTAVHVAGWVTIVARGVPAGTSHRVAIMGYVAAVILLQVGLPLAAGALVLPKIAPRARMASRLPLQGLGVVLTVAMARPASWVLWGKVLPWLAERAGWLPSAARTFTA